MADDVLLRLSAVIEARRHADPEDSYVARLYAKGLDAVLKKVGEEAAETIIAAAHGDPDQVVHETADLWFHTMLMLGHFGLSAGAVLEELERRFGRSGIEERASRPQ